MEEFVASVVCGRLPMLVQPWISVEVLVASVVWGKTWADMGICRGFESLMWLVAGRPAFLGGGLLSKCFVASVVSGKLESFGQPGTLVEACRCLC